MGVLSMETVYKYPLQLIDEQKVQLPVNAQPLHVGVQHGEIYVWCRVDPDFEATETIIFSVAGTGAVRKDMGEHLSTFMMYSGNMVLHVFYRKS